LPTDRRAAAGAVALVAGLLFTNSLSNGFAYDDLDIVVRNSAIQSSATLPGALMSPYWPTDYGEELGLWRPVTSALLGLQYLVGGGSPLLFHTVNVLLHVLVCALVVALLWELMSPAAAVVAGVVFAAHPVHVEAVANVVGVAEIVAAAAALSACLIHVRAGPVTGWRTAGAVAALYALGFGAKESAVTLPAIIFLIDAARRTIALGDIAAYLRDRWRLYAAMATAAALLLGTRSVVLGTVADPIGPLGADLLQEVPRIWTLAEIWTHYVRLWVFPMDLASDYAPDVLPISTHWHAANTVGLLLALLLLGLSLFAWRRPPLAKGVDTAKVAGFGVVWFVVTISPVSNALFLSGVLLAERTLYLPSVGLAAATGWLVVRLARERPRVVWISALAALTLAGARTWTRTPTWSDTPTVLSTLVEDYPYSGRSQWLLGDAFLARGRVREAMFSYRAAIGILGTHYLVMTEISKKLLDLERYRAAERLLEIAAEETPRFALAYSMLALIRAEYGDPEGTERYARASLAREDSDPTRHHLLAWALAAQGRWGEARAARARGLEQGSLGLWHEYLYDAYVHRELGDTARAHAAADSAWTRALTRTARSTLDSVRVAEFGLESRLQGSEDRGGSVNK
jgi:tetratricopeptide (TPR) repeat protein